MLGYLLTLVVYIYIYILRMITCVTYLVWLMCDRPTPSTFHSLLFLALSAPTTIQSAIGGVWPEAMFDQTPTGCRSDCGQHRRYQEQENAEIERSGGEKHANFRLVSIGNRLASVTTPWRWRVKFGQISVDFRSDYGRKWLESWRQCLRHWRLQFQLFSVGFRSEFCRCWSLRIHQAIWF